MGAATDLAFSFKDFADSDTARAALATFAGLLGTVGGFAALAATRRSLRREQRQNEIDIARVRSALSGEGTLTVDVQATGSGEVSTDKRPKESSDRRSDNLAADDGETGEDNRANVDVETLPLGPETRAVRPRPPRKSATRVPAAEERILASIERRAEARFRIQTEHYANALRQSTSYFYLSLFVGGLGFILLVVGVGLALAGLVQVGTVTGLGGVLTDGAAALIFTQANRAKADAQTNLAAIASAAERDEDRQMALIYSTRIADQVLRDAAYGELARKSLDALRYSDEAAPPPRPAGPSDDDLGSA